jgi:hypothetical protein
VAIDPQREARRARILIPLGILLIVASAALLVVGVLALTSLELDYMWMVFVGGFGLFPGIFMTVAGFHARGSARYAAGTGWRSPMGGPVMPMAGGAVCASCGNLNPAGSTVCGSCGSKLA